MTGRRRAGMGADGDSVRVAGEAPPGPAEMGVLRKELKEETATSGVSGERGWRLDSDFRWDRAGREKGIR